jgi:hypothetical protein
MPLSDHCLGGSGQSNVDQARCNLKMLPRQFDEALILIQMSMLKAMYNERNMIYQESERKKEYKLI